MQAQPCVNLTADFSKYRLASKQAEMSKLRTPGFISPQLLRLQPARACLSLAMFTPLICIFVRSVPELLIGSLPCLALSFPSTTASALVSN